MNKIVKQQDLTQAAPNERYNYIVDRWDYMLEQASKLSNSNYKEIKNSNPSECFRMLDIGCMRCILQSEVKKELTFFGKLSLNSGMPETGELWDECRCTYYVGRFWAGEKPNRIPRSPSSPIPNSKAVYKQYFMESEIQSYMIETSPKGKKASDAFLEFCPCECCSLSFASAEKKILKRHGFGFMIYADGRFYKGLFHNDQFHGDGEFRWPNGTVYKGEYRFGKKHGKGKTSYPNGDFHVGSYFNSKKHGFGISYSSATETWFVGNYFNDARSGIGILHFDQRLEPESLRWIRGNWHCNKAVGEFKGLRYDSTPIIQVYEDGRKISERVLVSEIVNLQPYKSKSFDSFSDLTITFEVE